MRFPTGSEVTRLRTRYGQRSRIYLGVQRGVERTSGCGTTFNMGCHYQIVAADAWDNDEFYLDFNVVTLVGSDIRPGMTLAVGTLEDPFLYGSARIRVVDATNQRLYLEPNNLNDEGYFAAGDYVYVDGVYRLYRILPYIETGTVYEDGNADSLEPGAPSPDHGITWAATYYNRPVALMGSPRPAFAGEAIPFYGWRSHARGGRNIQNWTWDFGGGVCEGPGIGFPGSPASPIMARWDDAGEYVASLVVEDDSGNAGPDIYGVQFNRHRAVRPVLVFDRPGRGDNPPYIDFEVSSLVGRYGSGWSCRITVFGTADKAEFPDNAMIILWAEDWHGSERGSIGGWYGQENILFIGHIRADSVEVDSEKSTVSFEANTIEQWMKEIDVWPANFVDNGAQNEWHEFDDMTIEDCLWHLAEIHSTLKNVTDCFFASDVNAEKEVDFLDLTEASLYDQMSSQIGSCFFGQLSASRHGSVHLAKHKNMMDLGERVWWGPPVYSFALQDWRDELQIGEERQRDAVAQVDFIGFVYDDDGNPLEVYSLAPERQTNFGGIEKVSGILLSGNSIAAGQAENDTLSGLYRAWKNIRFPHVRVPAFNNRILEPATLDYFAIVLAEADTVRGYDWPGKEFLTTGISVRFDPEKGTILTEVEGEASTWGPDGVAGPYPSDPPPDDPPADNPSEYWPDWPPGATPANLDGDPPPWADEDAGFGSMVAYLALGSGHVIRGTGLGYALGYDCRYHNCGLIPAPTPNIYWMALDQFDLVNTAMVATPYRVYKTTDLSADTPAWTQVFPAGGADWPSGEIWSVRSSEVQQDLWMAVGVTTTQLYIWWSTTGGDAGTWYQRIINVPGGDADGSFPFLELSTHDANKAWITFVDNNTDRTYIAYTDDMWATAPTFTLIPAACFDGAICTRPCSHHRRYDNDDDSVDLFGGTEVETGAGPPYDARVYFGTTCTTLYNDGAAYWNVKVQAVGCGVGTRNRWWALAHGDDDNGFWVSNDGTTWAEQQSWAIAVNGFSWYLRDCKNYRGDWRWYALTRDGVSYPVVITIDRGETWSPQFGNWPAFTGDEGLGDPNVIMICSSRLLP